jgi:hypothetical protein
MATTTDSNEIEAKVAPVYLAFAFPFEQLAFQRRTAVLALLLLRLLLMQRQSWY